MSLSLLSLTSIEEMGNPFKEVGNDLLILDTKGVVEEEIKVAVLGLATLGQEQYEQFVEVRLELQNIDFDEPIKRNKIPILAKATRQNVSKSSKTVLALKNDCSLFSRLYISCQVRTGNLDNFFCHENQSYPPALANLGELNGGSNSDLICCLEEIKNSVVASKPNVDAVILDGAAVVHMLKPGGCTFFTDYSATVFCPYLASMVKDVSRLDIVWDQYNAMSLKEYTRTQRGTSKRRRVEPPTKVPNNWSNFLKRNCFPSLDRSLSRSVALGKLS